MKAQVSVLLRELCTLRIVCVCACLWQSRCVWAAFRSSIYPRSKKARVGGVYNQTCIWLLQSFPVLNLNRLHSRRGRQDSGFGSLKMEGGRASVILGENKANDVVFSQTSGHLRPLVSPRCYFEKRCNFVGMSEIVTITTAR